MSYLDWERLNEIREESFWSESPYPWVNPHGLLLDDAYRALVENLPDVSLFQPSFGKRRKYGQPSHDRFVLDYDPALPIAGCWHEFAQELSSPPYREFLRRLFRVRDFSLRMHWHYMPAGCGVSPHCDARSKIGSHIFYLNQEEEWPSQWGGETLILDDCGRISHRSAPDFSCFERRIAARSTGNHSLLFARVDHSWHGVRPTSAPSDRLRKVFIVVVEKRASVLQLVPRLRTAG